MSFVFYSHSPPFVYTCTYSTHPFQVIRTFYLSPAFLFPWLLACHLVATRTAPTFNPSKPREIKRFFSELQYHFDTAEITDNTEKKNHATRYVDCDIADIWESLPSFSDTSKTFNNFKTSVLSSTPPQTLNTGTQLQTWIFSSPLATRTDLDSLADLAGYHAQFPRYHEFSNFKTSPLRN